MLNKILVCSYPKSGRTWLRFILANYFNELFSLDLDVNMHSMFNIIPNKGINGLRGEPAYLFKDRRDIPFITFSHARKIGSNKKVIVLLRNVYDALVSYYFHFPRQVGIKSFINNIVSDYVDYMNSLWVGIKTT